MPPRTPPKASQLDPIYVTVAEAARLLAVSRRYVYTLCASGQLESVALEGSQRARRIIYSSLIEFAQRQPRNPAA